jgi:hypothetical protein
VSDCIEPNNIADFEIRLSAAAERPFDRSPAFQRREKREFNPSRGSDD